MEKDTTYTVNRQELIRMARESCEGNLKSTGNGRFTYGLSKNSSKGMTKAKGKNSVAVAKKSSSKVVPLSEQEKRQMSIKFMLIRTICASVIFLAIVVVDKMDITYETFNSDLIMQTVESNKVYDVAEKFFASLKNEEIVDVFNGLD